MTGNPKPLSVAQVRLLLDIAASRPGGHHDATIIEALQRRGSPGQAADRHQWQVYPAGTDCDRQGRGRTARKSAVIIAATMECRRFRTKRSSMNCAGSRAWSRRWPPTSSGHDGRWRLRQRS